MFFIRWIELKNDRRIDSDPLMTKKKMKSSEWDNFLEYVFDAEAEDNIGRSVFIDGD